MGHSFYVEPLNLQTNLKIAAVIHFKTSHVFIILLKTADASNLVSFNNFFL